MASSNGPGAREKLLADELARTQRELARAEQRFRSAFGHQFQFMAILSPEGRVIDFNAQLMPGAALPREEVLGRLFWETAWWHGRPEMQAAWPHPRQAGAAAADALVSEDVFTSAGGETRWATAAVHAVRDDQGALDCFIVQAADITERRRAEQLRASVEAQLRESQKLQAIGTLAGGIAHDFNNILGAILGNVALARDAVGADHPAQQPLAQIKRAGQRARSLVQQILAFSRQQPHELRAQPLQPVVEETLALLRTTLPGDVNLNASLEASSLWVRCDATQIQQVLMNLCTNAWHALHGGRGHIEVGLAAAPEGRVHLWVRDDGIGMDEATRQRIFEPFFTTKVPGEGTGLGLSVVHGIVTAHGGSVTLDSEPGRGTVFHVHLPGAAPEALVPEAPSAFGQLDGGQGMHVLVLDDDEVMGQVAAHLLERAGYRVTLFCDPDHLLNQLRATAHGVDAVVTDFNMPGRNGLDVAREVGAIAPGLPLILSSGYIDDALRAEAARLGVRHLLGKENTLDDLCRLVGEVLERG